jgi:hypothetical protein
VCVAGQALGMVPCVMLPDAAISESYPLRVLSEGNNSDPDTRHPPFDQVPRRGLRVWERCGTGVATLQYHSAGTTTPVRAAQAVAIDSMGLRAERG